MTGRRTPDKSRTDPLDNRPGAPTPKRQTGVSRRKADGRRLEILRSIGEGRYAAEIAEAFAMTRQGVQYHTERLLASGLIVADATETTKKRKGKRAPVKAYRLTDDGRSALGGDETRAPEARLLLRLIVEAIDDAARSLVSGGKGPATSVEPRPVLQRPLVTYPAEGVTQVRRGREITFY